MWSCLWNVLRRRFKSWHSGIWHEVIRYTRPVPWAADRELFRQTWSRDPNRNELYSNGVMRRQDGPSSGP